MKKLRYIPKYDVRSILNPDKRKLRPRLSWYTLIATWFYVGIILPMPGTMASLATFPIYYFAIQHAYTHADMIIMMWVCFAILFLLGWLAIQKYEVETQFHDHSSIVIDEVLEMLLIFCVCFPQCYALAGKLYKYIDIRPTYLCFLIAFVTFRYFDIKKPFFIGYIDKSMTNSLSVILDDLVAALFSSGVIYIVNAAWDKLIR